MENLMPNTEGSLTGNEGRFILIQILTATCLAIVELI